MKEVERIKLLEYYDFDISLNKDFDIKKYDYTFDNIAYGVYRDTDMMIVYDEFNFVKTNIYGYEVSVNEFGVVVETGKNVSLEKNGYVISGHGQSAKLLKNVNVGDYVIYIDNSIYVYQNNPVKSETTTFIKFKNIIEKLNLVTNVYEYNEIAILINNQIPLLNDLYNEPNEELSNEVYSKLCEIEQKFKNTNLDNIHKYSYIDKTYQELEKLNTNSKNCMLFVSYTEKLYYGGFRQADTIVYYDKDNYRERNAFGYEVAVDSNNIIVDADVLVDLPDGGYILSGHSSGAEFIKKNLMIGDYVEITSTQINFYKDLYASAYNNLVTLRNEAVTKVHEHQMLSIPHDYIYIDELINNIDIKINSFYSNLLKENTPINIYLNCVLVKKFLSILYSQLIDYKIDSTRAMWYYPFSSSNYDDTSKEGILETLDKMVEMGINELIVIPFKNNYILYESEYFYKYDKLSEYSYDEYGNDYLKCFITEAHKKGILINAFTQTFRCFEEGSKLLDESYYQLEYDGSLSRGNIYYYDICNDNVQDVLYAWYLELVSFYDFDKIEYDIIRYSQSNLSKYSSVEQITNAKDIIDPGYTEYSMEKFKKQYNLVGDLKQLILQSSDVRSKWLKFKEDELINFITKTTNGIKSINPNIVITAAVLNDFAAAKTGFLQDAVKWLELGIVDQVEPMVYSDVTSFVEEKVNYYEEILSDLDFRMGLGNGVTSLDLMKQIISSDKHGYVLYSANFYFKDEYYNLLKSSYHFNHVIDYNNSNEVLSVIKSDIIDKINNYYEIKNNKDYDYLIALLEQDNYTDFKIVLDNLEDKSMSSYLLESFENIIERKNKV